MRACRCACGAEEVKPVSYTHLDVYKRQDLERATKMARAIVTQYGMSAELGTQVFGQPNHEVFLGRDYGNTQDYSEETAKRIDDEAGCPAAPSSGASCMRRGWPRRSAAARPRSVQRRG